MWPSVHSAGNACFSCSRAQLHPHAANQPCPQAVGFAVSGSGVGSAILSLLLQRWIAQYAWRGAMRILAVLTLCSFACLGSELSFALRGVSV